MAQRLPIAQQLRLVVLAEPQPVEVRLRDEQDTRRAKAISDTK